MCILHRELYQSRTRVISLQYLLEKYSYEESVFKTSATSQRKDIDNSLSFHQRNSRATQHGILLSITGCKIPPIPDGPRNKSTRFLIFSVVFFLFLILLRSVSTSQVACRCRSHIVMIRYINILSIVLRHQKISSGHRKSSSLGGVWPESCICAFFIFQSSLASRLSTFAAVAARFFGSGGTGGIRSCK